MPTTRFTVSCSRAILAAALLILTPLISSAQQTAPGEGEAEVEVEVEVEKTEGEDGGLREEVERQDREIELLKEKVANLEVKSEKDDEDDFDLVEGEQETIERSLDIYGFFDLTLFFFDPPEDSVVNGILPTKLSFVVNRLHLYFKSQMTQTLSALVEIRFTFLPLGNESTYNEPSLFGTEYQRTDTTVSEHHTTDEFRLGGIVIERVHLTWQPADFFGVIAGRFLTPFGIWNVEHGTPVLIPAGHPYFMIRQALPQAQTGLQIFGRFYPFDNIYVDYAVTLSNGRGPTESVYDLDNNKALGGRLRLSYDGDIAGVALGGYLFWGETTDIVKSVESLDPFHIGSETTVNFSEVTGSVDLLFRLFGLRVQGEFVRGIVTHSIHNIRQIPILEEDDPFSAYQPDYIKWGIYGLIAYQFDVRVRKSLVFFTPYFMAELYTPDDTYDDMYQNIYRMGLNFKPSPYVTLKVEANRSEFPRSDLTGGFWAYLGQMAVSF